MTDIARTLETIMARSLGTPGDVSNLARLSGGANMESSRFDFAGQGFVLRRAPTAEFMAGRAFGHDVEAAVVRAARAAGVLAPEIVAEIAAGDEIGTGYIMRRVDAEVNPAAILANPPARLVDDIARELARIHTIKPHAALAIPTMDTASALEDLAKRFEAYGGDRPVIALAIRWCRDHLPQPAPPVLVHGDFRMGNLMADADGLAAVLDWELVHWGDAHEDLAYGCMSVWRFGHIDRPAFGCADLDTYFAAYEAHSGCTVDHERFRFWLIYRTLWWALGCLQMADIWRTGVDRTLERVVIGRRTSENEADLLLLLEDGIVAPDAVASIAQSSDPDPNSLARRMGEPSLIEMLEALAGWVETDIKPRAQGRDKFMAAVALNALGMLRREAEHPTQLHDRALSQAILAGEVTLQSPGVLEMLRAQSLQKLANDSPKYATLAKAKSDWAKIVPVR